MFDLSWAELLLVAILAIVVVGPKDMPKLLRMFAGAARKLRQVYTEVQTGMQRLEQEVDRIAEPERRASPQPNTPPTRVQGPADDGQSDPNGTQAMPTNGPSTTSPR
jgi:sec-independent protein translocase protein TatB